MHRLLGSGLRKGAALLAISTVLALTVFLSVLPARTAALSTEGIPSPPQSFYVLDQADLLDTASENQIIALSSELAAQTGAQIVVVTVNSLGGRPLEEFSLALFRSWGIGDAQKDNGVLLLVAYDDRKLRIEVGYGLEGRINDAKAGRIRDNDILPYFKQGDYLTGIRNGYFALLTEVVAEYPGVTISPYQGSGGTDSASETSEPLSPFMQTLLLIGVVALLLIDWIFLHGAITRAILFSMIFRRGGGSFGGGGRSGGGGGGFSGGGGSGGGGGASGGW
jgi:uncharacterized protein